MADKVYRPNGAESLQTDQDLQIFLQLSKNADITRKDMASVDFLVKRITHRKEELNRLNSELNSLESVFDPNLTDSLDTLFNANSIYNDKDPITTKTVTKSFEALDFKKTSNSQTDRNSNNATNSIKKELQYFNTTIEVMKDDIHYLILSIAKDEAKLRNISKAYKTAIVNKNNDSKSYIILEQGIDDISSIIKLVVTVNNLISKKPPDFKTLEQQNKFDQFLKEYSFVYTTNRENIIKEINEFIVNYGPTSDKVPANLTVFNTVCISLNKVLEDINTPNNFPPDFRDALDLASTSSIAAGQHLITPTTPKLTPKSFVGPVQPFIGPVELVSVGPSVIAKTIPTTIVRTLTTIFNDLVVIKKLISATFMNLVAPNGTIPNENIRAAKSDYEKYYNPNSKTMTNVDLNASKDERGNVVQQLEKIKENAINTLSNIIKKGASVAAAYIGGGLVSIEPSFVRGWIIKNSNFVAKPYDSKSQSEDTVRESVRKKYSKPDNPLPFTDEVPNADYVAGKNLPQFIKKVDAIEYAPGLYRLKSSNDNQQMFKKAI